MKKKILLFSAAFLIAIFIFILTLKSDNEYKESISNFEAVEVSEIEEMLENSEQFILYIGRESCPACVDFVPLLSEVSNKNDIQIYYLDSTDSEGNTELSKLRNRYDIEFVPSLLVYIDEQAIFPNIPESEEELERTLKALGFSNN